MHILFFLSGASALMYEVVWIRRLSLTLGHTVLAISTVVTIFMLGLAIGGFVGGRWADRRSATELLRDYGRLELLIAVWGALSLLLLAIFERVYLALAGAGQQGTPLYLCGFLGATVVLLLPTIAMGATLPLLSRLVIHGLNDLGPDLAKLYGVNTLGGCVGSAAAGFVLLPWLGLSLTTGLAAFTNLMIAVVAYSMVPPELSVAPESDGEEETDSGSVGYLLVACLAAAAAMACQVGWTRGLVLSLGSSTYAFAAILTLFLAGLGLGSLCYRKVVREPSASQMGWLQFGIGASVILTVGVLGYLPLVIVKLASYFQGSFAVTMLARLIPVILLLILPTFLMGIVYPLATHLFVGGPQGVGRTVGTVYAATTLGSIAGAFGAGFLGIPLLGAQGVIKLAAWVSLALALGCFLSRRDARGFFRIGAVVVVALVGLVLPRWNPAVMSSGAGVYSGTGHLNLNSDGEFIPPGFYRDGLSATVAVHIGPGYQTVRVNGKIDASLQLFDRLTMYLTGYVPALLHGDPKDVVVVGFGAGMTVEALSHIPSIRRIDCVELEPAMLEAGSYWRGYNSDILAHPKVKATVNDGRTFILASPRKFDIIASEPSNPWIAGVASLFTADFYQHCAERLNEGGVMCQWFHMYGMSEESVALVVRTFYSVFPEGAVWRSARGDLLLLGSETPLRVDLESMGKTWGSAPALQRRMLELNLYKEECLLGHYWLERDDALSFAGSGPLNTDDLPLLEFMAPLTLFDRDTITGIQEALESHRSKLLPVKESPSRLAAAGIGWLNTRRSDLVRKHLTLDSAPLVWARMTEDEDNEIALRAFDEAVERSDNWVANFWLANFEMRQGRWLEALPHYKKAWQGAPESVRVNILLAQTDCALEAGQFEIALELSQKAVSRTPGDSRACLLRGRALYHSGRFEEALSEFELGTRLNPSGLHLHLGRAHSLLQLGRDPEPVYQEIISLSPGYQQALLELARYQASLGRTKEALETVHRAAEYFPEETALRELEKQIESGEITPQDVLR
jgi:spermidine synthase